MEEETTTEKTGGFQAIDEDAESVYKVIFQEMEDAVFFIDVEQTDEDYTFRFQRNNASHQQLTGLSEDELRGQTPRELLGDEQGATVAANYRRCVEQRETIQYEETLELPAGTSHWQTKLTPITDGERVTQVVGVARNVTGQKERQEKLQRLDRQFETVLNTMSAAVFLKDTDGKYLLMNRACQELLDVADQDIVGLTDEDIFSSEVAEKATRDDRRVIENGEMIELEEEVPTASGNTVRLTRKSPVYDDDGEVTGICGVSTEITEQKQREKTLRGMYKIGSNTDLAFDEKVTELIELGHEYLDLPYGFFTSIDGQIQEIVHARGSHKLLQPGESAPLEKSYCRKTIESDSLVGMENAEQVLGPDDDAYDLFNLGCYIGTKVHVDSELYGTFCFAGPEALDRSFTADEQEIVKLLGQWVGYELEQSRVETRLQQLHEVAEEMLVAEDTAEVASIAVEAGRDIFDLSLGACWEYDAVADVLRPLAETAQARETIGATPTFERDDALVWGSFDTGEIQTFADLSSIADTYNEETPLRSEVHVPLGDRGMMIFASTEDHAFGGIEINTIRLLGSLVREGLIAAERQEQLVDRSNALQRQNESLEEFASLVAHDLRNPLTGAISSLEVAQETHDPEWFERTEQSLWRMNELVDELLAIARGNRQDVVKTDVSLSALLEEAWSHVDAPDASLTITDRTGAIRADETRLLQLFGNLFRNSVEHAGEDVNIEVGPLPDSNGFYIADDGPGLPEDVLEAFQEYNEVGTMTAGGIGLVSVVDVVDAHGWDVSVSNTGDGVRFEIRTGSNGRS